MPPRTGEPGGGRSADPQPPPQLRGHPDHDPARTIDRRRGWSVVHTRGEGVRNIAELLSADVARPVRGDLRTAILDARAEMLVARHLTTGDLVKQAVPFHIDLPQVRAIVGAIGTGPHTSLVAEVADLLSTVLEVPGSLVAASPDQYHDWAAEVALDHAEDVAPGLSRLLVRVTTVEDLLEQLPKGALLVLGTPGGSWLQRQFFGPGRRLTVGAPAGALAVRDAPERCFQRMAPCDALGPEMRAADALRCLPSPTAPVARDGMLLGIVRRSTLLQAHPGTTIGTVMEEPVSVGWDAPVGSLDDIGDSDGAPLPVVGPQGELLGSVRN